MWMLYCFMLWWKEDVEESTNKYKKGRKFCVRCKCSTDLCYDVGKRQNNKEINTAMEENSLWQICMQYHFISRKKDRKEGKKNRYTKSWKCYVRCEYSIGTVYMKEAEKKMH